MRAVAGLGNPGVEYAGTRHNVGFDVLDMLAERLGVRFRKGPGADVAEGEVQGRPFALIKPMTYMNRSGRPIREFLGERSLEPGDLLVVVDDFHLELGRLRLRRSGSDGGHNGLRSIQDCIGSGYPRLRIGIGPLPEREPAEDFVLRRFRPGERRAVEDALWRAAEGAEAFAAGEDLDRLIARLNAPV